MIGRMADFLRASRMDYCFGVINKASHFWVQVTAHAARRLQEELTRVLEEACSTPTPIETFP